MDIKVSRKGFVQTSTMLRQTKEFLCTCGMRPPTRFRKVELYMSVVSEAVHLHVHLVVYLGPDGETSLM